jgi:GNAT superfamily N-acetyltransferase
VQLLGKTTIKTAADVLGRAMADDPGWRHVFPDPMTRVGRLTRLFDLVIDAHFANLGASHVVDGAAAIWAPPGHHAMRWTTMLRIAPRIAWLVGRRIPPALALMRAMDRRAPSEPHYYLAMVGVAPEAQGRGLGVAILRPILERCDETRTLAWLESANPKNHSFYRKLGFEPADEATFRDGPTLTWFARQPR